MWAIGERLDFFFHLIRERRWSFVLVAWGVALIGSLAVVTLPDSYESAARVYVDTSALPGMHALAPTPTGVDQNAQLAAMRQVLTSRPDLEAIVTRVGLAAPESTPDERERALADLSRGIEVDAPGWNLFRVSYRDHDPATAGQVVAMLLDRLAARLRSSGREDKEMAQHLLEQQITAQAGALDEADRKLAALRERNPDLLLGEQAYLARLEQARQQARDAQGELEAARAARAALEQQLSILPATILVAGSPASRSPQDANASGPAAELVALERKLAELETRYTERHPDVIATRRAVEALRARTRGREPSETWTRVPSPAHDQLRVQLAQKEAEIAGLQERLQQAGALVTWLADRAQPMPEVEAEHRRLLRERTVIKQSYDELAARQEQARIAINLEARGEQPSFRVIDPPQSAVEPVGPPRLLLLLGVLAAAACAGAAYAAGRGAGRAPFLTVARLERAYPLRVLGSLSSAPVPVPAQRSTSRRADLGFALAAIGVVALVTGVALAEINQLIKPLRATVLQELVGRNRA